MTGNQTTPVFQLYDGAGRLLGRFDPVTADGVNTSGTIQVRQSLPPCKYTRCTNNNSVTVRG